MWKSYTEFIKFKIEQTGGEPYVVDSLRKCIELQDQLNTNRRSHPDIVSKCSKAFYDHEMKPWIENDQVVWTEPADFPLLELRHRVIFVHVEGAERQQQTNGGASRNDAELFATQTLKMALMELGIPSEDILLLAAYALQAGRIMNGRTVFASQGFEKRVVIYTMASYAKDAAAGVRQSMRDDIVNTAVTRAQSLALIVGDSNAVRRNMALEDGTRQLLNQCPVIQANDLLSLLKVPCNVNYLNEFLLTADASDPKKRKPPSTPEREPNKRAKVKHQ